MTKDIKKLTSAELLMQNEKLDGKGSFPIIIGEQEYEIEHDLIFRKSKQNKLLDDVIKFFTAGAENVELLDMATPYTALLILKHFTSLEVSDEVSEALDLLAVLVDLEVLDKMVDGLPEGQVTEVFELITRTVNSMTENIEDAEEEAKQSSEQGE